MESNSDTSPLPDQEVLAEGTTGPYCSNSCPELQQLDWWSEWQAVVGEENLQAEPTEAEFVAWLEYREALVLRESVDTA